MIAVLANVITSAWSAACVHLMRRDAPIRQRRATSWVDQSPILASFAGLVLLAIDPAPAWSSDVLTLAGPLLAFSGAALFTGSMLHPHNVGVVRTEHALRRWTWLTGVRVAYYLVLVAIAALASSTALAVVAVLSGLSAPSFQPVQQAVLYGYRSEVVMTAIRWGWVLVPARAGAGCPHPMRTGAPARPCRSGTRHGVCLRARPWRRSARSTRSNRSSRRRGRRRS